MKALIGIDAGHGGASSGTHSINSTADGLFEKDFALEQALLVEKMLLENGFGVVMTRRTDTNPGTVAKRAALMAERKTDFALSIHFNGYKDKSANGCEVFVPYGEKIAYIEKGFYSGFEKFFKLRKPFARSSDYYNSDNIFDKKLDLESGRFGAAAEKTDYFGFVRECWKNGISADLLEICFLTNPKDFETYLQNREEIAKIIAKSIVEGFGETFVYEKPKEEIFQKPKIKKPLGAEKKKGGLHLWEME